MVRSRAVVGISIAACVATIAACNSDRAYAPPDTILTDRQVSMDVASSAGDAIASDLETLDGSASMSGGNFSIQSSGDALPSSDLRQENNPAPSTASSCTYSNGRWGCTPVVQKGITTVRSY